MLTVPPSVSKKKSGTVVACCDPATNEWVMFQDEARAQPHPRDFVLGRLRHVHQAVGKDTWSRIRERGVTVREFSLGGRCRCSVCKNAFVVFGQMLIVSGVPSFTVLCTTDRTVSSVWKKRSAGGRLQRERGFAGL